METEAMGSQVTSNDIVLLKDELCSTINKLTPTKNSILIDIAIKIFANTNFNTNSRSIRMIVKDCISYAKLFVEELEKDGLIENIEE